MATLETHRLAPALRELILTRDQGRCWVAQWLGGECHPLMDVHHIVPSEEGGLDDESNLASVCHSHHPMWERLRQAVLNARGPRWKRCPHHHVTRDSRADCERRMNHAA